MGQPIVESQEQYVDAKPLVFFFNPETLKFIKWGEDGPPGDHGHPSNFRPQTLKNGNQDDIERRAKFKSAWSWRAARAPKKISIKIDVF